MKFYQDLAKLRHFKIIIAKSIEQSRVNLQISRLRESYIKGNGNHQKSNENSLIFVTFTESKIIEDPHDFVLCFWQLTF